MTEQERSTKYHELLVDLMLACTFFILLLTMLDYGVLVATDVLNDCREVPGKCSGAMPSKMWIDFKRFLSWQI